MANKKVITGNYFNNYFPKDKLDFRICWIWNFAFIKKVNEESSKI